MKLTGVTLVRNGEALKYPWKACVKNLIAYCDEVIVNLGDSFDNTREQLFALSCPNLKIIETVWNMSNTGDGKELAEQANLAVAAATGDWIIYLQADELISESDHALVRQIMAAQPEHITQIEFLRTYFWENLTTRATDLELYLGRAFRRNTHIVGGDGMHLIRNSGDVARTSVNIFHYSRIGTEQDITLRIRTLDGLFHEKEAVEKMQNFTYNEVHKLDTYSGSHPEGIVKFYTKEGQ